MICYQVLGIKHQFSVWAAKYLHKNSIMSCGLSYKKWRLSEFSSSLFYPKQDRREREGEGQAIELVCL